jgi:hypothetical protein
MEWSNLKVPEAGHAMFLVLTALKEHVGWQRHLKNPLKLVSVHFAVLAIW